MDNIRNIEGHIINTKIFSEEAQHFKKYGYYCADAELTPSWFEYWGEQRRRCLSGYESGGLRITGDMYHYLNFSPIQKVLEDSKKGKRAKKGTDFPDFWDGDYNYFWIREIARNGILSCMGYSGEKEEEIYSLENQLEVDKLLLEEYNKLYLYFNPVVEDLRGGKDLIVGKARRKGYQQPNSEIVMTPNGKKTMGELRIGDEVLTPSGKSKILEIYPQGLDDVYELTLYDGRKVRCGIDHLWKVYSKSFRKGYRQQKIVDTNFLLSEELKNKKGFKWYLQINNEVSNENLKELPIPPYTLGCILGDGNVTKQLKISGIDSQIFENILNELGDKYYFVDSDKCNKQLNYRFTKEELNLHKKENLLSKYANRFNPLYLKLSKLNLNCKADFKFIPDEYKYNSTIEERYELIRGLMDTDGYISEDSSMSFSNISERLVKDMQEVLYSLGISSVFRKRKDGLFIIYINTNKNIFKLERKILRLNKNKVSRKFIPIINIEKSDYQEESSCILIDSKDHLYLTKDYIVTHNSFKNASIFTKNFFHIPNSYTMFIAYEKKYLFPGSKTVFGKALNIINFVNTYTAFSQPSDEISKQNHIRASYIEYDGSGKKMSKGFMSEGEAISFKDNPDSGRGADAYDIFGEEVGAWGTPGGLKETLQSMRSSSEAGIYKTGLITLYGTSGDVLGSTADFNDLFNRPQASNFMAFYDIWGDMKEKVEGLFMPKQLNLEGFQNVDGISDIIGARKAEVEVREELIRKGATSAEIRRRMLEEPLNSGEAFSIISFNNFPIVELENRRKLITVNNQYRTKAIPVEMFYDSGELKVEPILKLKHDPIWSFKDKTFDTEGCILIYHQPNPNYLKNSYAIGYDPYRQDKGDSNGSIVVIDKLTRRLAAKYIGRREDPEAVDKIAEMLCDYYNSRLMFENEVTSVKNYFKKVRRLHLLAFQPDYVITKEIKKSKVKRIFGCHMTESLKDAGERYTKEWFLDVIDFDEDSKPITVIDTLWDLELIEEAIAYYRKGNFDTISALFMALFDMQETLLSKRKDDEDEESNAAQLMKQYHAMIKN